MSTSTSDAAYSNLRSRTRKMAIRLRQKHDRLVLAESCTGGLLASLLTEIPGISEFFCGSHVVYREGSKHAWLGVPSRTLKRFSAVSSEVAEAMVRGALRKTPEATIAGAITGYLGPSGKDVGLIYYSVLHRGTRVPVTVKLEIGAVRGTPEKARLHRRAIAAEKLLEALSLLLNSNVEARKRTKL